MPLSGADWYPTPTWGTEALLRYENFNGKILEPCCGDGSMAKVLSNSGYDVIASDLYDRGYGNQKDAFDYTNKISNLITNPPFNLAEELIDHFLPLVEEKLCLLLRTSFVEGVGRYNKFYANIDTRPSRIRTFSKRLTMVPGNSEPNVKVSGTVSFSWFIWDKKSYNNVTEFHWISPTE